VRCGLNAEPDLLGTILLPGVLVWDSQRSTIMTGGKLLIR